MTGHLNGGGSIGVVLNATSDWTTFNLGWTNLTHVTVRVDGRADGAIDNIVVNVRGVPEPGTLVLLGLGLLGIGAARRRKAR